MKTIIPAQPGFFATYETGERDPIIAWEIESVPVQAGRRSSIYCCDVKGITPKGYTDSDVVVVFERG